MATPRAYRAFRLIAFVTAIIARTARAVPTTTPSCKCSGAIAMGGRGRNNYGAVCAHWDAPDEEPWCVVEKGACGDDNTFRSDAGHFWAHAPCHGEGLPFVAPPEGVAGDSAGDGNAIDANSIGPGSSAVMSDGDGIGEVLDTDPDGGGAAMDKADAGCVDRLDKAMQACGPDHLPTSMKPGSDCSWLLGAHSHYLPDAELVRCADSQAFKTAQTAWKRDADKLQRQIQGMQHPSSCGHPRAGPRAVPPHKWHLLKLAEFGLGSVLKHFAKMMGSHWAMGIPVIVGNSLWRYTDHKCGDGWSCHLSPLSGNCSLWHPASTPLQAVAVVNNLIEPQDWPTLDRACGAHGNYSRQTGRCHCAAGYVQSQVEDHPGMKELCAPRAVRAGIDTTSALYQAYAAPGEITTDAHNCPTRGAQHTLERKWGKLWYDAQVLHFLFSRAPKRAHNLAFARSLGLKRGCIAMHVRHGDSCGAVVHHLKRKCQPLSAYVKAARSLFKRYGKRQVFIASDDPKVIAGTKLPQHSDIDWKYQDMDRAKYDSHKLIDFREDMRSGFVADELFRDMYAMARCDMIVGQFTSNIDRIVLEMIVARRGHYVPFISLDAPWCSQGDQFTYEGTSYTC